MPETFLDNFVWGSQNTTVYRQANSKQILGISYIIGRHILTVYMYLICQTLRIHFLDVTRVEAGTGLSSESLASLYSPMRPAFPSPELRYSMRRHFIPLPSSLHNFPTMFLLFPFRVCTPAPPADNGGGRWVCGGVVALHRHVNRRLLVDPWWWHLSPCDLDTADVVVVVSVNTYIIT